MHDAMTEFQNWCIEHGKKSYLMSSFEEYNKERGFKSKYIGRRIQVNADGRYKII